MPAPEVFPSTECDGCLQDNMGGKLDIRFSVSIDKAGLLQLYLEPIPERLIEPWLRKHFYKDNQTDFLRLEGVSLNSSFYSDQFCIVSHVSKGLVTGVHITLTGRCETAVLYRTADQSHERTSLTWITHGFPCFGELYSETDIGTFLMHGNILSKADAIEAVGCITVFVDGDIENKWWKDSCDRLEHILRVMSFAVDMYLDPHVKIIRFQQHERFWVGSTGPAPIPFIPPFRAYMLQQIFTHSCTMDSCGRDQFARMERAIRWLVTPVRHDEVRMVMAMTALESILFEAFAEKEYLLPEQDFCVLAKLIQNTIKGSEVPKNIREEMYKKIKELNRRTLIDKLESYISYHQIPTSDFPERALRTLIMVRNEVVHRGIGQENRQDVWPYVHSARELVTRILFCAMGFEGEYYSMLHGEPRQLHFPPPIS